MFDRRHWIALLLGIALFLVVAPSADAAQTSGAPHWRTYTNEDGLLSNDIWSVLTVDDVIWLGTDRGIVRYDGSWTSYRHSDNASVAADHFSGLPSGSVVALAESASDGFIWAATDDGAISYWNGNSWIFAISVASTINDLAVLPEKVLIGTEDGLMSFASQDQSVVTDDSLGQRDINEILIDGENLWIGSQDGLWFHSDDAWTEVALPQPLANTEVFALWSDGADRIWIGTDQGVFWYEPEQDRWANKVTPIQNERGELTSVVSLTGDGDVVWVGSMGGGARKVIESASFVKDLSRLSGGGLTTPLIRDIVVDGHGGVWFATPAGLFHYLEHTWINDFLSADGHDPRLNAINDLLYDSQGRLWVATAGAGIRLNRPSLIGHTNVIYNSAAGHLPSDGINAVEEDSEGGIWAGTFAGLSRYQNGIWASPIVSSSLPSLVITDLLADGDGMWIGTEGGLVRYDIRTSEVTPVPALDGQIVEALAADGRGNLWVGTPDNGIWTLDGGNWQHMEHDPDTPGSLPGNGIMIGGLARDPVSDSGMWANIHEIGLAYWDDRQWHLKSNELSNSVLYRLYSDPVSGDLWIGSEGGVSRYDGETWGTFTVNDGLLSSAIYAIVDDGQGAYWFGGPEGLSRYEPDSSSPWVRVRSVSNTDVVNGVYQVPLGQATMLDVTAGDLQTLSEKMRIYYRTDDADEWKALQSTPLVVSFDEPGRQTFEFSARDEAFNYAPVIRHDLDVIAPPAVFTLPILGEVDPMVAGLLALLAAMAVGGLGYVTYVLFNRRARSYAAMYRGYNPYVSGEPIRDEDMFFGRRSLLARIVNTLHNNSIMIHGERRIGKTTLLYQLANALRQIDDPDYWFLTVYVDLEGTIQEEFFHYLMEEIAVVAASLPEVDDEILGVIDELRFHDMESTDYDNRDFSHDLRNLIGQLQRYSIAYHEGRNLRLILLMDEMDVISNYDHLVQQQLRRIFMRDFAATLGAVVAGIQISKDWDRVESPWFNLFNEIELQPFDRDQARTLLTDPVRSIYRFEPSAIEYIIEESDGRPFRIQQYALESVNHMLARRRRKITLMDAEEAGRQILANNGHVAP